MYLLDPIFKELSSIVDINKLLNECNLPILLFCFENELDQNGIFSAEKRIHKKNNFQINTLALLQIMIHVKQILF